MSDDYLTSVAGHYAREGSLAKRILTLVAAQREGDGPLSFRELAPVDQFHLRGRDASEEMAALLDPKPGARILDVGSGIGGSARLLASAHQAEVVGIDLTASFCADAAALSAATGLDGETTFICADATRMPLGDASVDLAWTQHVAMNIPDKGAVYKEVARVLKPGGRFALYDIMLGPAGDPHYPTPWASRASASFLLPPPEVHRLLQDTGLREHVWLDRTAEALGWIRARQAAVKADGPPPLSLQVILGEHFGEMMSNVARNLEEGRIVVQLGMFRKPLD